MNNQSRPWIRFLDVLSLCLCLLTAAGCDGGGWDPWPPIDEGMDECSPENRSGAGSANIVRDGEHPQGISFGAEPTIIAPAHLGDLEFAAGVEKGEFKLAAIPAPDSGLPPRTYGGPDTIGTLLLRKEDAEQANAESNEQIWIRLEEVKAITSSTRGRWHDDSRTGYLYKLQRCTGDGCKEGWGNWTAVCTPDPCEHQSINDWAIPLAGTWDEDTGSYDPTGFTFGCLDGVLAKCYKWGYRPFSKIAGDSFADAKMQSAHQACTRLARADYCGDGTPHTTANTKISFWDENLEVANLNQPIMSQAGDVPSSHEFEGAWGPDGAHCVSRLRKSFQSGPVTCSSADGTFEREIPECQTDNDSSCSSVDVEVDVGEEPVIFTCHEQLTPIELP